MSGTARAGKLAGIEAGRGLAATAVVLYHAARHLNKAFGMPLLTSMFQFGHAGVDFFFVISGFIIVYVHYGDICQPRRLGHYVERRLTRVYPTYWVALALTIAMHALGTREPPAIADAAWSLTLLPSQHELLLGIAWTLQYEIVFYLAFCVLILHRLAGLSLLAVWLLAIIVAATTGIAIAEIPGSLYGAFNLQFFFGMAAAYAVRNYRIAPARRLFACGVVLFVAAAVAEDLGGFDGYADYARLIYGLPSALIVTGAAAAGLNGELRVPALLRVLGSASYSIYLFQFVFIGTVWQLWLALGLQRMVPHGLTFIALAGAAIVGGVLMSRWVEHPLIRLCRSGAARWRPQPVT